uniref:Uncharacterized protein n=1 Tax=Lotharella oceanica TaxID=641309 RepID=A0A7S2TKG4_9EUKA|mmetsp:Transcript_18401/g.34740  ORF Transcript_18401/g.34740 Transcript_18401/m.34740 type:complete len:175 (+) Transcript_18401:185-709(+)
MKLAKDKKAQEPHGKNHAVETSSTMSINYTALPSFAEPKAADKKALASDMWIMARTACNQAHHIQNLATRLLISQPHQPCINEIINLAGQVENQCRASLRSLGNFGTRPYNPKQMNNQMSREVQNQVKAAKMKIDALLTKKTNDAQLETELTTRSKALSSYFSAMTAAAQALAA